MRPDLYRLATETKRHLLAIVEEIDRYLDQQPNVLTDRNMLNRREPTATQSPRNTNAFRRGHGVSDGSSRR